MKLTFLFFITLSLSLFANAADPCAAERARVCPGKSGPLQQACLKANEAKLSLACRTPSGELTGCKLDAEKLCSGFGMKDGLLQCLTDHQTELSTSCRANMKPTKTGK